MSGYGSCYEVEIVRHNETAWKLYMSDVADMRNHINPLYENLLKIVGKTKDSNIKVYSEKAFVEQFDTFYYAVYTMTQKKVIKKERSSEKSEADHRKFVFLSDIEEIGGFSFKRINQDDDTNEDVGDNFCADNDSDNGSIDIEKI